MRLVIRMQSNQQISQELQNKALQKAKFILMNPSANEAVWQEARQAVKDLLQEHGRSGHLGWEDEDEPADPVKREYLIEVRESFGNNVFHKRFAATSAHKALHLASEYLKNRGI